LSQIRREKFGYACLAEGAGVPELTKRVAAVTTAPCFALMLAFAKPLTLVRILYDVAGHFDIFWLT
jgi:hypothetical protein